MLTSYFKAPYALERFRSNLFSPFLDGFAQHLGDEGYVQRSVQRSLRTSIHLGLWMETRGQPVNLLDSKTLADFEVHLPVCRWEEQARVSNCSGSRWGLYILFRAMLIRRLLKTKP